MSQMYFDLFMYHVLVITFILGIWYIFLEVVKNDKIN